MGTIGSHRPMVLAQAGFLREVRAMFADAARQISGAISAAAEPDGSIAERNQRALKIAVGRIVSDLFTPGDNRSAYADDGVTPRSPYAAILNKWLALATFYAIQQQEAWLRAHVPADVFAGLRAGRRRWVAENALTPCPSPSWRGVEEGENALIPSGRGEIVAEAVDPELLKMAKAMRLFAPNPNTRIDPNRQWVPPQRWTDDKGYRLSDRIWRVDEETRRQIDSVLTQALRDGTDAIKLSRMLTAYLDPTVTKRTDKPYQVSVNYAAMRLARTEISRAFNEAAYTAGLTNPYVNGYDVARSGNGDPECPVCPQHATIDMNGMRVREPYPMEGGRQPPNHPHCMCGVRLVTQPVAEVTAALRAGLEQARAELNINPADARAMTIDLLGNWGDPAKFGAGETAQVGMRMTPAPASTQVTMSYGVVARDAGVPGETVESLNAFLQASDGPLARALKATADWDNPTPALDLDWDTNQYVVNRDNVYEMAKAFVGAARDTDYSGAYLVSLIQEKAAAAGVVVSDRDARALYNREYQAQARAILTLANIGKVKLTDPQMRYLGGAADGDYYNLSTTVEQAQKRRSALEMKGIGNTNMTAANRAEMRRNFLEITGRLGR